MEDDKIKKPTLETIKAWLTDQATAEQQEEIYRDLKDRSGSVVYELFRSLGEKVRHVIAASPNDPPSTVAESLTWLEKHQDCLGDVTDDKISGAPGTAGAAEKSDGAGRFIADRKQGQDRGKPGLGRLA